MWAILEGNSKTEKAVVDLTSRELNTNLGVNVLSAKLEIVLQDQDTAGYILEFKQL